MHRENELKPPKLLRTFQESTTSFYLNIVQFASRLATSLDYYLKLRNVRNFQTLKNLVFSDKICQTLDKECFTNFGQVDS